MLGRTLIVGKLIGGHSGMDVAPPDSILTFPYKILYGTDPFPFWFIAHTIFTVFMVHQSAYQKRQSWQNRFGILIASAWAVFGIREVMALLMNRLSPIKRCPLSLLIYVVILLAFELTPRNRLALSAERFMPFFGLIEGLWQFKLFTFGLRNIRWASSPMIGLFSGFWILYEIGTEWGLPSFFQFKRTPLAGATYMLGTAAIMLVYWLLTHKNWLSGIIGTWEIIPCAVIFATIQGAWNAYTIFTQKVPPPKPRK
jgi:hypothetical protein